MSLKDRFDRFIDYFTEDEDSSLPYEKRDEPVFTPVNSSQEPALPMNQPSQSAGNKREQYHQTSCKTTGIGKSESACNG